MCDKLKSVKVKVIYVRCIKGDYRWGVLPLLEFSTNMVNMANMSSYNEKQEANGS